jgi:hypothetical protein
VILSSVSSIDVTCILYMNEELVARGVELQFPQYDELGIGSANYENDHGQQVKVKELLFSSFAGAGESQSCAVVCSQIWGYG